MQFPGFLYGLSARPASLSQGVPLAGHPGLGFLAPLRPPCLGRILSTMERRRPLCGACGALSYSSASAVIVTPQSHPPARSLCNCIMAYTIASASVSPDFSSPPSIQAFSPCRLNCVLTVYVMSLTSLCFFACWHYDIINSKRDVKGPQDRLWRLALDLTLGVDTLGEPAVIAHRRATRPAQGAGHHGGQRPTGSTATHAQEDTRGPRSHDRRPGQLCKRTLFAQVGRRRTLQKAPFCERPSNGWPQASNHQTGPGWPTPRGGVRRAQRRGEKWGAPGRTGSRGAEAHEGSHGTPRGPETPEHTGRPGAPPPRLAHYRRIDLQPGRGGALSGKVRCLGCPPWVMASTGPAGPDPYQSEAV